MKIAVIFPTKDESKHFKRDDVDTIFGGVGLIASTYSTTKYILTHKPDVMIMAGIAGVYKGSDLKIGDSILVNRERISDLGFFNEHGFKDFSKMELDMDFDKSIEIDCPYIDSEMPFRTGVSNSMNCAMASFVDTDNVDVENMEGAGFFYACNKEGVKFYELRTISNEVNLTHDDWDYDKSIRNLTTELNRLIDYLQNKID